MAAPVCRYFDCSNGITTSPPAFCPTHYVGLKNAINDGKAKALEAFDDRRDNDRKRTDEIYTIADILNPIFKALGWVATNRESAVKREVPCTRVDSNGQRKNGVLDYGFYVGSPSRLYVIVEAKRADVFMKLRNDDRWQQGGRRREREEYADDQILDYMRGQPNVPVGLLTNGNEWRIYRNTGQGPEFFWGSTISKLGSRGQLRCFLDLLAKPKLSTGK